MSGAVPILPMYVFKVWTGNPLPLPSHVFSPKNATCPTQQILLNLTTLTVHAEVHKLQSFPLRNFL